MTLKITAKFHGKGRSLDISRAASDSKYILPFEINITESISGLIFQFFMNVFPVSDCNEANRNCFFRSYFRIKSTAPLQRLQMPSNNINGYFISSIPKQQKRNRSVWRSTIHSAILLLTSYRIFSFE